MHHSYGLCAYIRDRETRMGILEFSLVAKGGRRLPLYVQYMCVPVAVVVKHCTCMYTCTSCTYNV